MRGVRLCRCDFCRTWSLWTAADFERYLLTVFEGGIAVHFDFRVVDKEIFAAIFWCDESVAFFSVEPFYVSCAHILVFLILITDSRRLRASARQFVSDGLSFVANNRSLVFI